MGKEDKLNDPLDRLSKKQVRGATKKDTTEAGQYKRKTIMLPHAQIDYIDDELCKRFRMGKMEMYRFIVDAGLEAIEEGLRPEPQEKEVTVRSVKKRHWTSQVEQG